MASIIAAVTPRGRHRVTATRLALTVMAATVALLGYAAPAQAHSALVSSDPAASSRVAAPPAQLTLAFTDPVNAKFVTIRLAAGTAPAVDLTSTTDGKQVTAQVPSGQPVSGQDQSWTVTYRVVSADGHPISGSYIFTVAAAAAPTTTASSPATATTTPPTSTAPATTAAATPSASSTPTVQADAIGPVSGRENATGNRLPAGVMALLALPLLAAAAGGVWWFRRQRRTRQ